MYTHDPVVYIGPILCRVLCADYFFDEWGGQASGAVVLRRAAPGLPERLQELALGKLKRSAASRGSRIPSRTSDIVASRKPLALELALLLAPLLQDALAQVAHLAHLLAHVFGRNHTVLQARRAESAKRTPFRFRNGTIV